MTPERLLILVLRIVGSVALLAIPWIMLPYSVMNGIHEGLGMGRLPDAPIVGYLARSTSFFYALLGGLLWIASLDLSRHRVILCFIGLAAMLLGITLYAVDFTEGMPLWWSMAEGTINVLFGATVVMLSLRVGRGGR
jgi:hypothetical protein